MMRRIKEFQDQSVAELNALSLDLAKEIYNLNNELTINRKIEKPHLLRQKKRDRARVLTILSQKEGALHG
jgi:large subunit ribosomal protein L29